MAFQVAYIYDCITKLCRKQAEVIQNHENENVLDIGKDEAEAENISCLNLVAVKRTAVQVTKTAVVTRAT
jgi:hypothetical protein